MKFEDFDALHYVAFFAGIITGGIAVILTLIMATNGITIGQALSGILPLGGTAICCFRYLRAKKE